MNNIIQNSVLAWYKSEEGIEVIDVYNKQMKFGNILALIFESINSLCCEKELYAKLNLIISKEDIDEGVKKLADNGLIKIFNEENLFNEIFN